MTNKNIDTKPSKTKILLVQASKLNSINPEASQPLGLMYLASALRKWATVAVSIVDLRIETTPLYETLERFKPDIIGISGFTQNAKTIQNSAETVKNFRRTIPVVIGGPHATAYWDDMLKDKNVDIIVRGEGEFTILELVNALGSGSGLTQINGLAIRKNSSAYLTPSREIISNLDILPFPAWDLIDNKKYYYNPKLVHLRAKENYMAVFSSRGCPYQCSYCHNMFGKKFRPRSPENVFEEIHLLYKNYGVRQIEFWDDIFNFDRKRAEKILYLIRVSGMNMKLSFPNGLRSDLLDKDLLKKMKEAGTVHIGVAVETASSGLQKAIHKNLNLEKVKDIISQISKLGILARGFFILGFPKETKREMKKTINFALKSSLHMASFFVLNPYKGTQIYFEVKKLNRNINTDFYSMGINSSTLNLSDVRPEEINILIRRAYFAFYFKGLRLLRLFMVCPSKVLFFKQFFKYVLQLLKRMKLVRI